MADDVGEHQAPDGLEAAVLAAYGWPADLNAERAAGEARGHVRWLRAPATAAQQTVAAVVTTPEAPDETRITPWPADELEQTLAVQERALARRRMLLKDDDGQFRRPHAA